MNTTDARVLQTYAATTAMVRTRALATKMLTREASTRGKTQ